MKTRFSDEKIISILRDFGPETLPQACYFRGRRSVATSCLQIGRSVPFNLPLFSSASGC